MEQTEVIYILRRIIVGIMEGYYMVYFQVIHCGWKKARWHIPGFILCVLAIAVIGDGPLSKPGMYPAALFIVAAILILFSRMFLEGNVGKHFFILALSHLLLALNDTIVALGFVFLFHIKISDMRPGEYLNDILSIITKLILLVWMLPYFMWVKGKKQNIPMGVGGRYAFWAGLTSVLCVGVMGNGLLLATSGFFICFQSIVLFIFLVFYFIILHLHWSMQKANEKRITYELEYQKQKLDKRQVKESQKLYNSLKELRHDMKNHMSFMEQLVERKDYEKLKKYLEEMRESVYSDSSD